MHPSTFLVDLLRPVARRIALRMGGKRTVHELVVTDLTIDDSDSKASARIEEALSLIHRHHPAILRRMTRDLRYVVVTRTAGSAGEYWEDIRSVLLDESNARRQTVEAIAMIIVHEATHARLWRMGLGRFPDRERIERACVMAEIAFARRVGGLDHLITGAEAKLASRYWERSRKPDFQRYLQELGFPVWAQRLLGPR